ncbi:hypothetical protein EV193_10241 [Herbihabitans rhizosphaerae]|uniref:Secreted protein n=1 Tax=Herbihabitans rhizosphaerae TaxID=1872711 RepID=A0A4Q7L1N0_9PSEU|nr:hypothetical protein [Herbihabitans rhizosphaerae]RZS43065.1 hypothetical protein EV193_10241 [Herbihabitans rhizosphaerae]
MSVNRRLFITSAAGIGGIGLLGAQTAQAAPADLTPGREKAVLAVARAGAVFPIEFPSFGEPGPAVSRATPKRLRTAAEKLTPQRFATVVSGIDHVSARVDLSSDATLLPGLSRLYRDADLTQRSALVAAVALAAGTVSTHLDPSSDNAARLWLDGLARIQRW